MAQAVRLIMFALALLLATHVHAQAPDQDGDGIPDTEDNCPLDENNGQTDIDNDGIGDACDIDMDADGVINRLDPAPSVYRYSEDSDEDGLPDQWEKDHSFTGGRASDLNDRFLNGDAGSFYEDYYNSLIIYNGTDSDLDGDGLNDLEEFQLGTRPDNPDTDFDTVPDGLEQQRGTNPLRNDYPTAIVDYDDFCVIDDEGLKCVGRDLGVENATQVAAYGSGIAVLDSQGQLFFAPGAFDNLDFSGDETLYGETDSPVLCIQDDKKLFCALDDSESVTSFDLSLSTFLTTENGVCIVSHETHEQEQQITCDLMGILAEEDTWTFTLDYIGGEQPERYESAPIIAMTETLQGPVVAISNPDCPPFSLDNSCFTGVGLPHLIFTRQAPVLAC